jgi:hypothetical protein
MANDVYAVYHRVCDHVAAIPSTRDMAASFVDAMAAKGQRQWRVRVASDDDIMACLRADRCLHCSQDGEVTSLARLPQPGRTDRYRLCYREAAAGVA